MIGMTAGTAPYRYFIDGGAGYQPDPHFPDAPAGDHAVMVTVAVGNLTTTSATVQVIPPPTMTVIPTAATCLNNDGVVEINGATGPSPYRYALDGGSYTTNGTIDHVSSGGHQAYVKDGNGCIVSQPVTVSLNDLTVDGRWN